MTASCHPRVTYRLGAVYDESSYYFFTELPEFKTLEAAVKYQQDRANRSPTDVIFEDRKVSRYGVVYGCLQTIAWREQSRG